MIETARQLRKRLRKRKVQQYNEYRSLVCNKPIPTPVLNTRVDVLEIINIYNKSFFVYGLKDIIEQEDLHTGETFFVFSGSYLSNLKSEEKLNDTSYNLKFKDAFGNSISRFERHRYRNWTLKRSKLQCIKFYWNESQSVTIPTYLSEHWKYPFITDNPFGKLYELMSSLQMQICK